MAQYLDIEAVSDGVGDLVKQDLKFRTGKFVWRVKFSAPLNPATVNNTNLYVTDANGKMLKVNIHYDTIGNYIEIEPTEAYEQNESYVLNVTTNVESKGGQKLNREARIRFRI